MFIITVGYQIFGKKLPIHNFQNYLKLCLSYNEEFNQNV
jgi:hypothetical protein